MTVVTISRQLGSFGCEIGRQVSERLGFRLVQRELLNQAARAAGAPEAALDAIDDLGLLGISPSPKARKAYTQSLNEIMNRMAEEGRVVIIGRAGQVILGARPDVLHVRVFAPASLRAGRIALQQDIALEQAQAQIEASDSHRQKYLKRFYGIRWDDPELYDLLLNTAHFSIEAAASIIVEALQSLQIASQPSTAPV